MAGPTWVDALVGTLRCPGCARAYLRQDVAVVGERDGYMLLRCECRMCGREGVVVAAVHLAVVPVVETSSRRPAITDDDVIEAHDILSHHNGGGVAALFRSRD